MPDNNPLTICPLALTMGCAKCPFFKVCPLKAVIGDYRPPITDATPAPEAKPEEPPSA